MRRSLLMLAAAGITFAMGDAAQAAETLHVYGPGGPLPAMKEAAAVFGRAHGVDVEVTAGPTPKWIAEAKNDADLILAARRS